jgi:hypothetical protein
MCPPFEVRERAVIVVCVKNEKPTTKTFAPGAMFVSLWAFRLAAPLRSAVVLPLPHPAARVRNQVGPLLLEPISKLRLGVDRL